MNNSKLPLKSKSVKKLDIAPSKKSNVNKSAHEVNKAFKRDKKDQSRDEYLLFFKKNPDKLMRDCDVVFGELYRLILGVAHAPKVRLVHDNDKVIGSYSKDAGGFTMLKDVDTTTSGFSEDFIQNGGPEVLFASHLLAEEDLHKGNIGKNKRGKWVKIDNDRSGYSWFYRKQGTRIYRPGRLKDDTADNFFPLSADYMLGKSHETKAYYHPFKFRFWSWSYKKAYGVSQAKLFRKMSQSSGFIEHTLKSAFKTVIIPDTLYKITAKIHTSDTRFASFIMKRAEQTKRAICQSPELIRIIKKHGVNYSSAISNELDVYLDDLFGKTRSKRPEYRNLKADILHATKIKSSLMMLEMNISESLISTTKQWKKESSKSGGFRPEMFKILDKALATCNLCEVRAAMIRIDNDSEKFYALNQTRQNAYLQLKNNVGNVLSSSDYITHSKLMTSLVKLEEKIQRDSEKLLQIQSQEKNLTNYAQNKPEELDLDSESSTMHNSILERLNSQSDIENDPDKEGFEEVKNPNELNEEPNLQNEEPALLQVRQVLSQSMFNLAVSEKKEALEALMSSKDMNLECLQDTILDLLEYTNTNEPLSVFFEVFVSKYNHDDIAKVISNTVLDQTRGVSKNPQLSKKMINSMQKCLPANMVEVIFAKILETLHKDNSDNDEFKTFTNILLNSCNMSGNNCFKNIMNNHDNEEIKELMRELYAAFQENKNEHDGWLERRIAHSPISYKETNSDGFINRFV